MPYQGGWWMIGLATRTRGNQTILGDNECQGSSSIPPRSVQKAIMAQKHFNSWHGTQQKHRYEGQLITALGAELDARRRYDGFAVLLLKASDGTAPKGIPKIAKVMDGAIPASAGGGANRQDCKGT